MWVLIRAGWFSTISYRLQTLLSAFGVLAMVVPLYFIADAMQPTMAESIKNEGGEYFGFLIAGMIALIVMQAAITSLPRAIQTSINVGTLEALMATPARVWSILGGFVGVPLIWTAIRISVLLVAGWVLGVGVTWGGLSLALAILVLTLLAYIPVGLISAALVLVFRTAGPIPSGAMYVSIFLGGVYYPTHIIPSWIEFCSQLVPLTYGLRAFRRVILDGGSLAVVSLDLTILVLFILVLTTVSGFTYAYAFRYAKRAGTLTQY
jgi:ABC-2 type transport system permease protein